jgi:hypothetical protein
MATRPQSLPVQYGVETERENNKLEIASSGRKNGEPLNQQSSKTIAKACGGP